MHKRGDDNCSRAAASFAVPRRVASPLGANHRAGFGRSPDARNDSGSDDRTMTGLPIAIRERGSTVSQPLQRCLWAAALAAGCVLLNLVVTVATKTHPWAFHHVPVRWWVASLAVLLWVLPFLGLPSQAAAAAVGLMSGGLLGNITTNTAYGSVPDPLVIQMHGYGVAFNPADLFIGAGFLTLSITVFLWVRGSTPRPRGVPLTRA